MSYLKNALLLVAVLVLQFVPDSMKEAFLRWRNGQ